MSSGSVKEASAFIQRGEWTFDKFAEAAVRFHGHPAPGVLLGYHLVMAAWNRLPKDILFDAICETRWCLPDVVQILTPCTVGNGWLRIVDLGLYALSLYDKFTGKGVRAYPDADKIARWEDAADRYLKRKPKQAQRSGRVREQLRSEGHRMVSVVPVQVRSEYLQKRSKGPVRLCPRCGEAYPAQHGGSCRQCQGDSPYKHREITAQKGGF
jgi:formylmethanofuran dehydrogenase subunit E